ncbi:hypothetical protein V6N11_075575 [Hibiscus sabdariffa]|uniref:Uncharacterized protein n=1 Tax=Hibiscus sabdariffa TaxID=183260 RepID=A0ABR2R793_9ROSI
MKRSWRTWLLLYDGQEERRQIGDVQVSTKIQNPAHADIFSNLRIVIVFTDKSIGSILGQLIYRSFGS